MLETSSHEWNMIVRYSVTWVAICQNRFGAVKVRRVLRFHRQQLGQVQQQLCHSSSTQSNTSRGAKAVVISRPMIRL